jgi:hypothetical protein
MVILAGDGKQYTPFIQFLKDFSHAVLERYIAILQKYPVP